jgi:hypothetical protein
MSIFVVVMATPDYKNIYEVLSNKVAELWQMRTELEVRLGDINKELEGLQETMTHLGPLAGYTSGPDSIAELGITDAVRGVLDPKVRMSAAEVKAKMEERGFDFSKYSAPEASVRTILKRLVEAKKAEQEKEGYKIFYRFLPTDEEIPF